MGKRALSIVLVAALFFAMLPQTHASASNFYLIPDSNKRLLTEEELWGWQYRALGFILNEIFARYGFPFDPDGNYYDYFNAQSWYVEDPDFSYSRLNNIEWQNEHLVKVVRQQMRDMGTTNPDGKSLHEVEPDLLNTPDEFVEYVFTPGQKLSVYTGPGTAYVRAANGKAVTSTNGTVYVYGWDSGWLMVLYRTNNGGARIGYVDGAKIKGSVYADYLEFEWKDGTIKHNVGITDDPVSSYAPLATLRKGDSVSYLCTLHNDNDWAYVEAETTEGTVRGCIPLDALDLE